uniref:Uncharacterized protein n=1 Tax=Romanomermis culicivorax TaxID=13658 RepID=A0A915J1I1_ROMCU
MSKSSLSAGSTSIAEVGWSSSSSAVSVCTEAVVGKGITHLIICSPNVDSIVTTTGPWALTRAPSATLVLPHIRSRSDCLLKACLTNPEDNTEHCAPVSMSACALTVPNLMEIWKARVDAYLGMKVFDDGVRLSIWQTNEWMWHGSPKAWPVAFQQTIPGLTIRVADAISLEGMIMLAAEVD